MNGPKFACVEGLLQPTPSLLPPTLRVERARVDADTLIIDASLAYGLIAAATSKFNELECKLHAMHE